MAKQFKNEAATEAVTPYVDVFNNALSVIDSTTHTTVSLKYTTTRSAEDVRYELAHNGMVNVGEVVSADIRTTQRIKMGRVSLDGRDVRISQREERAVHMMARGIQKARPNYTWEQCLSRALALINE